MSDCDLILGKENHVMISLISCRCTFLEIAYLVSLSLRVCTVRFSI